MDDKVKTALHAGMVAIAALAMIGGASLWAVETLVAAEVKPIEERISALERLERRSVMALEGIQSSIRRIETQHEQSSMAAQQERSVMAARLERNSTDIGWIKKYLEEQKEQQAPR